MIFEGTKKSIFFGLGLTRAGASAPSTTNLMALAKVFDVSAEELLKETQKN